MSGDKEPEALRLLKKEAGSPKSEAVDVREIAGSIKWFDVSKGFGFIIGLVL